MSFDPPVRLSNMDGEYVSGDEARLPIWDHGVLYGDGIFEGMRLFSGRVRPVRPHLERLATRRRGWARAAARR